MVKRELELHRLNTHSDNRVLHAAQRFCQHAFNYGGHIGTHLIVGGVDPTGPYLIECQHDGNSYGLPYLTTGSGMLAATAILETEYKDDMTRDEAVNLVTRAIEAGIYYDMGSGSNVDVCVIHPNNRTEYLLGVKSDNFKIYSKPDGYKFDPKKIHVFDTYNYPSGQAPVAAPAQANPNMMDTS